MTDHISKWSGLLALCGVFLACGSETPQTPVPAGPEPLAELTEEAAPGAPRIDRVELRPEDPVAGGAVKAEVSTSGTPAHETRLAYEWFVDGRRQTETGHTLRLEGGVSRGSRIEVSVVARHDEGRSQPVRAQTQVGNSAPVLHRLAFEPAREISASHDLMVIPNATDSDDDDLDFDYVWEVNGSRHESRSAVLPAEGLRRGDSIRVRVRASDGDDWSNTIASDVLRVQNSDPRITSTPGAFDDQGRFVYSIQAEDPDGDRQLSYRLLEGPDGMVLDVVDATLRWTPTQAQAGKHPVRIEVSDRKGGVATQSFVVELGFEGLGEAVPAAAEEPY